MKLQELVSHHAGALNETDLAVWRYIESHPQECCYISIYDLANRCHVSRTSVLRFAKKLDRMGRGFLPKLATGRFERRSRGVRRGHVVCFKMKRTIVLFCTKVCHNASL